MFRNLVANAVFSPSVVNSIGFYIRRLRQEEFTRRLGLVFCAMAVALQSLAIISPPEPTIAAGPNNIIYSGVTSISDLLNKYDANDDGNGHRDIQAIFDHYGISRDDLAQAKIVTIRSTDRDKSLRSIGRKAYGKTGETAVKIAGSSTTVYERYLWSWDSGAYSTYKAIQGTTGDGRWFAVLMNCGNVVIDQPPPVGLNPVGSVLADCTAITGWAYDPNSLKTAIKVQVSIGLKGLSDKYQTATVTANLSQPAAPVAGNHGFKVDIPPDLKSADRRTVYSVVAIDSVGGGGNTTLASNREINTFCQSPPSQPSVTVCDKQTGQVVSLPQGELDPDRHVSQAECDKVQVCINDELVTLPRFEASDQPADCPPIQVCRGGTVITITSDQRQSGDLDPEACDQIEVCREGQLVTILRGDRHGGDTDPHPTLLCDDPFPILAFTKTAANITQNLNSADGTTAEPGDVIVYTLEARNIGTSSGDVEFVEDMSDVLEYADLVEYSGGVLDEASGVISWDKATLAPQDSASQQITVKIKSTIPAAPSPVNNLESHNLELRNVWQGQSVVIKVPRPITKTPEVLAANLPETGPGANAAISLVLIMASAYFYARNRQLVAELKLVQLDYAAGASR